MLEEARFAVRTVRARPLFSGIAVLLLALGIGSNAAVFAVLNSVLVRPLPYHDSERLVSVYSRYLPSSGYDHPYFALSDPEFADLRSRVRAFADVAAYNTSFQNLATGGGDAERVLTMAVTTGFFDVLAVRPAKGRTFTPDEALRGGCVAIVSHALAQRPGVGVPGSTIRLDDEPCVVLGEMPQDFAFADDRVQVWRPMRLDAADTPVNRASHSLAAVARLRDGVTIPHADAELHALRQHWSAKYPDHYATGHFAVIRPLHEDLVGDQRPTLLLLGGAVLIVLAISCVNVAALLLSRSEARRREFAVRQALGAGRVRLLRQVLIETMVLALAGGVLGVILAHWVLAAFIAFYPGDLPASAAISIDASSLLFSAALVVAAGLLVAVLPALHAAGVGMHETLHASTRSTTTSRRGAAVRSLLVVGQLALSIVLLVAAGLLVRSYQYLQRVDLGLRPERLLTFTLSVPDLREPDPAGARRLILAIEERLVEIGDVEHAAIVSDLPLVSAGPPDDFVIDDRPAPAPGAPSWNARFIMASPRYFEAMRIPLRSGRLLSDDDGPASPLVAVIDETAARLYWPNESPVGRTIRYYPRETSPPIRIVGVVGQVRSLGPRNPPPPAVYVPYSQAPRPSYSGRTVTMVARARRSPTELVPSVRAVVRSLAPGLPVANVRPMTAILTEAGGESRFTTLLISSFAGVAFLLAALGLYGVLSYGVERRVREIGIRLALGARADEIVQMIVARGVALVAIAIAVGVPAAAALTRVMAGLIAGVSLSDAVTYVAVVVTFVLTALVASYLPARRATMIDPTLTMRSE